MLPASLTTPGTFSVSPRGPFDLRLLAGFGFGPDTGRPEAETASMRLAFCRDDLRGYAGVVVRQDDTGVVHGEVHGDGEVSAVKRQIERILSLDHDGEAWLAVGRRDPVIGELQQRHPGLRPPLFHSPYEAAAWAIISARRPARQAASTRREIAERLGASFDLDGDDVAAFPTPEKLLELEPMPSLPEAKVRRLHGVAAAALAGRLDADRLRSLEPEAALAELQRLAGIGPFYATLILVRSTGHADVLADNEPRLLRAIARSYDLPAVPSPPELTELAEPWRPFRTWAGVLLRYATGREGIA